MPNINAIVRQLVSSTWNSWEQGKDPDYKAILASYNIATPDSRIGLLDSLQLLGLEVTHWTAFSTVNCSTLDRKTADALCELLD